MLGLGFQCRSLGVWLLRVAMGLGAQFILRCWDLVCLKVDRLHTYIYC